MHNPAPNPLANATASQVLEHRSFQRAATSDTSKQDLLISGVNIKTINGTSVLGSGNLVISASSSIARTFMLMGA